jgi:hypothetical protein
MHPNSCGLVAHVRLADQDVVDLVEGQLVVELEEVILSAHAKNHRVGTRWSWSLLCCVDKLGGLGAERDVGSNQAVVS